MSDPILTFLYLCNLLHSKTKQNQSSKHYRENLIQGDDGERRLVIFSLHYILFIKCNLSFSYFPNSLLISSVFCVTLSLLIISVPVSIRFSTDSPFAALIAASTP